MNNNTEIDIEIQLAALNVWADRALFYLAKMYTEQINAGEDYTIFKKCVSISILDFELLKDNLSFIPVSISAKTHGILMYTDKMEFHVLELPKLPKELKEDSSDIELWGKFISAERERRNSICLQRKTLISTALTNICSLSVRIKEKRMEYEAREKGRSGLQSRAA